MGSSAAAADEEAEHSAERAAAEQPVIHDDQPADADHRSPAEREVVDDAQLAGERSPVRWAGARGANYKALAARPMPQLSGVILNGAGFQAECRISRAPHSVLRLPFSRGSIEDHLHAIPNFDLPGARCPPELQDS